MNDIKLESFYKNKKVLIPGGAGFIGSNLTQSLVRYGALVTIVDPFSEVCGANACNIRKIKSEITFIKRTVEHFLNIKKIENYDIIFNCVGLTNHHWPAHKHYIDYEINCRSGLHILETLKKGGRTTKLISIGSRTQYGKTAVKVIDESHPLKPIDIQSIHKTTLEHYHQLYACSHELDLVFIRLTNVYGMGQRLKAKGIGFVGEMIKNSLTGDKLIVYGDLNRAKDILYVEDVVNALLLLGAQKKPGFKIYNVGGQVCKLSELISAIKKNTNRVSVKIQSFPTNLVKMDTGDSILDIQKIKNDVGWKPTVDIHTGIDKTLRYYHLWKKYYL